MARRRFAGRLAVIGLIGSLSVAQTGCGFLFSHGPPVGHEQMDYFTCTEGNAGPIIDVIWGALNLLSAVAVASDPSFFDDANVSIAASLVWTVLSGAAAGVGFNKSKKCLEAKRQWADRQALNRAQMPGPQLGTVQAVVIRPRADTLAVGDQTQLVATAHASSGETVPGGLFTWSSSNDSVATVTAGLVTGTTPGAAVITATTGGVSGTARIVVTPP